MGLKYFLSTNRYTMNVYSVLREKKRAWEDSNNFRWHGTFIDRQNGHDRLCIVLAGYKEFLYDVVFERIKTYLEPNIDVCVVTSGLLSERIDKLCEDEGWSYLSTKENNVSLVQNVAIDLHPNAKWIYKLDEDVFITEGYFQNMMRAYEHADLGFYNPGIIAPLIPVNGYGYVRILQKINAVDEYSARFERPQYATGQERCIEGDPKAAEFMWGAGGVVPKIDDMNEEFKKEPIKVEPCAMRFSIGAILFSRELWDEMGHLKVESGTGMGLDEIQLCQYCAVSNRPIMVSENVVVGHLSFGQQNRAMKEYFLNHTDRFCI